jgi:putative cell wall-binding protein
VRLNRISGHRDTGNTECPGNKLYPLLPSIRRAVAARMKPALARPAVSSSILPYGGGPVTFTAAVPTNQTWNFWVSPMCPGRTLAGQHGQTATRIRASWDLTDGSGNPVVPGVYRVVVRSASPVGRVSYARDVEVLPTLTSPPAACRTSRIATTDAYVSSVLAGWSRYPDAHTVVLTSSRAPMEGLAAAPLAASLGAPLMMTSPTVLPGVVARSLAAHGVTTAYLVGTASSVNAGIEAQVRAAGVSTVIRVGGRDQYEVAAAVARRLNRPGRAPILVSGSSPSDAAAAAGPAAATVRPLLYVSAGGVPSSTAAALKALSIRQALVVGSPTAVRSTVHSRLRSLGINRISRLGSADPAATAAAVATAFMPQVGSGQVVAVPAAGGLWAVMAAGQARLTLFTQGTSLPAPTTQWLNRHRRGEVRLVSGPARVSTSVLRALAAASA